MVEMTLKQMLLGLMSHGQLINGKGHIYLQGIINIMLKRARFLFDALNFCR